MTPPWNKDEERRVRIESDGIGAGTHVYGPDGQELPYVTRVTWTAEAGGLASAVIEVAMVEVAVLGQARIQPQVLKGYDAPGELKMLGIAAVTKEPPA